MCIYIFLKIVGISLISLLMDHSTERVVLGFGLVVSEYIVGLKLGHCQLSLREWSILYIKKEKGKKQGYKNNNITILHNT